MKKIFYFSSILILILTIFSCSPALSISLKNDDSVDIQFEISNTESFFSNFSQEKNKRAYGMGTRDNEGLT